MMTKFGAAVVMVLGFASSALAQSRTSGFIAGGPFLGIEEFTHITTGEPGSAPPDPSGTTGGVQIGVGTYLGPRVSVRLELAFRGTLDETSTDESSIGGGFTVSERERFEERMHTGAVLMAYHQRTDAPVSLEYLGGVGFVRERIHTLSELTANVPNVPVPARNEATIVSYGSVAVVGMDAAVKIGTRLAFVPLVRAFASGSSISIEPGVNVRWSF